jgi:hypothetical protein
VLGETRATGVCRVALAIAVAGGAVAGDAEKAYAGAAGEWLLEPREGVVELRLVHHERGRPDGGELLVDSNRRVLIWGHPGEIGCRQKLEAPSESVRAVETSPRVDPPRDQGEPVDGGCSFLPTSPGSGRSVRP